MNSLQTTRQCFDQGGAVLQSLNNNTPNPYPGQQVTRFAEVDANGNAFTCDNCNSRNYQPMDQDQIDNAAKIMENLNQYNSDLSKNLEQFQIDLQTQLNNMFSGSFPF